ncbi:MAG: PilZ domain-containing protein [Candidatus Methylomirabilales bacterium]
MDTLAEGRPKAGPPGDRRGAERRTCVLQMRYQTIPGRGRPRRSWRKGFCLNCSAEGLLLQIPQLLPPGTGLRLEIYLPARSAVVACAARVRWNEITAPTPQPGDPYRHGAVFTAITPEGQAALETLASTAPRARPPRTPRA